MLNFILILANLLLLSILLNNILVLQCHISVNLYKNGFNINKENLIRKEVENKFENNFADFWIKILTHNVFRYQAISKEVGALEGLIVQVIAWHHYLSTISEVNEEIHSFDTAFEMWHEKKVNKKNNKKLTISLVSELTTIPFETTRRKIKKLVKKNWITYTKENGIVYNSNSELNDKIVNKIHPVEKDLLKEFLVSYLMSDKDN